MTTIGAGQMRIPRSVRDAVSRREKVVVVNRERPVYVIVHPDDVSESKRPFRRGRPLGEALDGLFDAATPDPAFVDDMEAVLDAVGPAPSDPWAAVGGPGIGRRGRGCP